MAGNAADAIGLSPRLLPSHPTRGRGAVSTLPMSSALGDEFGAGFVQGPGMSPVNGRIRGCCLVPAPSPSPQSQPCPEDARCSWSKACRLVPYRVQSSVCGGHGGIAGRLQKWPNGLTVPSHPPGRG